MIALIDVWTESPPPGEGGSDDDLLRLATYAPALPTIVIGDRGASRRAREFGVRVIEHHTIVAQMPWIAHRRIARTLRAIGRPDVLSFSGFAETVAASAGAIRAELPAVPESATPPMLPSRHQPSRLEGPLLVPLATHISGIDAVLLVETCAVLEAGRAPMSMLLPASAARFERAKSLAACADRSIRVIPTRAHPLTWLGAGTVGLNLSLDTQSPQLAFARGQNVPVLDARRAASALSLASIVRRGVHRDAAPA